MKIRTLWERDDSDPNVMPWLVAACDEYTEEEHGEIPHFYQKELEISPDRRRELTITIPDAAVAKLFAVPEVGGKTE